jgi:hypothetical protein
MTSHDEQLFLQGMLFGATVLAYQRQHELTELEQRLQKVERGLWPALRLIKRLVPIGRRDGHLIYRIMNG